MSNKAAVLNGPGARLVVEDRPIYEPGKDEILVKVHALSVAPVDWKMQDYGVFVEGYPLILGSDVSGTVEAVGSGVTHFQKGDRITGMADVLHSKDSKNGAFQQYTVVKTSAAAKIPESIGFDEASIIPMGFSTAAVGIFLNLGIPRPPAKQQGAFLVWGASSSVGTAVVQIAKSLGYTVYGVNSPKHNDYVKKLGATQCFNYNDNDVVKQISQVLKASGQEVIAYDAISEHGSAPKTAEILDNVGGGKICLTLAYPDDAKKAESVQTSVTYAMRVAADQQEFGHWLFNEWLEKALVDKTFVPSPGIQKIDGGINAVQKALDTHKAGVSGVKLVLNP